MARGQHNILLYVTMDLTLQWATIYMEKGSSSDENIVPLRVNPDFDPGVSFKPYLKGLLSP